MAKVTGPLMSLSASGKLASTIVFSIWKGTAYVRQLVIPTNPQSSGQQEAREKLGAAGRFNSFVGPLSPAQVELNSLAPSGQSGVSFFAKKQIERYATSKTDYNNVTYATEKGYFDAEAVTLGIDDVIIPGAAPVTVPGGLILWNAYDAMHTLDPTLAPSAANAASSGNVTTFANSLSA